LQNGAALLKLGGVHLASESSGACVIATVYQKMTTVLQIHVKISRRPSTKSAHAVLANLRENITKIFNKQRPRSFGQPS
jgi:hypothetical protein